MVIDKFLNPFPYIIIHEFLNRDEYPKVFDEIIYLSKNLKPEKECESAYDIDKDTGIKNFKRKGKGIWVGNAFSSRDKSQILTIMSKKLFSGEIVEAAKNHDWYFSNYYGQTNIDNTILQSYGDQCYYKKHRDSALFSTIALFHKKPKEYTGGELYFSDYNLKFDLNDNQSIIFPSQINHEVFLIKKKTDDLEGNRFTLTNFANHIDNFKRF